MIKNVFLKKILKNSIFKFATLINKIIPKDDSIILLYKADGTISYGLVPLKNYLLENEFDKKYKIICVAKNKLHFKDNKRVRYVSKLNACKTFFRAGHVFYAAGQIPIKPSKNQIVIHLCHGNAHFKSMGKNTNINNGDEFFFTYMAASSPLFVNTMCEEYDCTKENIAVVGDPMIDVLLNNEKKDYQLGKYKKMILWVPTFRQSDYLGYDDASIKTLVPLFDEIEYKNLNQYLAEKNIKIIVKLHGAQTVNLNRERPFTNLDIYSDEEFKKEGFDLYELMKQSDALIGDYSSASMQYLVLDKPMAFVVPDIDEYSEKRGFVFKNPEDYMAGHIVKNKNEFNQFIEDLINEKDVYKEKRNEIRKLVYTYSDNQNCKRIVELSELNV